MRKLRTVLLSTFAISALLVGCSDSKESSSEKSDSVTMKLAHTGSESHQYQIGAKEFADLVEEKSGGEIKIDIHGNSTLGDESEAIEQVMDGSIDMAVVSADSSLANTVPEMNVFGIPYLFEDREHVYSELDGETGDKLLGLIDEKGMKGLGFWEIGFRHLTNNDKEIKIPADLKGMKIRVQPAVVWETHMKALGASATPVSFTELYSALDQGLVDGQENPLSSIYSMRFYEVQKYISLTSHTYSPAVVVMSNRAWDKLSDEQKGWIEEAEAEAATYQRDYLTEKDEEIISELKGEGVTFTEPDRDAFKEATKEVKNSLKNQVPADLIEEIQAK
ncbi:C4-dicarboxylate ABC transporter substrate-binding protein [Sporosarcina sp. P26b]|uniref:TRAP transporter substrate-binding protein n=1 Tax=Sporosarcina sp. P26b TaxID=2048253 RepID=UPI000C16F825|nr:TRAP transporter substrate-binding protein [Sporosarcina sp. P26b]PIC94849.1 C4-dicarboxylate ABC transporter substrate-binding protein [Sporosarcina sp. P26b]